MTPTPDMVLTLLGNQEYSERLLVDQQTTQDIIESILDKHLACEKDYDKFSYLFAGGSVPAVCRRLYDFCRDNLEYFVESTAAQYTSKPKTILERGTSDCKGYALFICGVLSSLNRTGQLPVNWCYRFASYKLMKKNPHHVFAVVRHQGHEIFVDPVFNQFNYHKPAFYNYDYCLDDQQAAAVGCLYCAPDGSLVTGLPYVGTGQQTGAAILKITGTVSPYLAEVPVVGWALIGAGALTGLFLSIWGSRYTSSSGVRWLEQMFDYYVRGMGGVTSDNKVPGTSQDITAAQDWFGYVLGVPIYDKYRWHALRGENGDSGQPLGITQDQMVRNYLAFPEVVKSGTTYDQALAASNIALGMEYHSGDRPGLWANMTAAPSVFAATHDQAAANAAAAASILPAGGSLFSKPIFWIVAGVAAVLLLSKEK